MAPPRRKQRSPHEGREFKLRIPEDIARRIEAKSKKQQRPQNRIVVDELSAIPRLEQYEDYEKLLLHHDNALARMEVALAQYSVASEWLDLSQSNW